MADGQMTFDDGAGDVPPWPRTSGAVDLHAHALALLRESLGPDADFRDGQWEAIEALVERRERLLVVQRTGWGKSSVYFLTTRLMRERGAGPTILISPLLALMRDQIRAAARFGLRAETINSTNTDDWHEIAERVRDGAVDVLLVSPERLANDAFRAELLEPLLGGIGLLVVDEAHCISDWGHDFRPDYRRIRSLLPLLGEQTAILGTTATANDAVVQDVAAQLGGDVRQIRGSLSRRSLQLQAIHLPSHEERTAWLTEHLPAIDGSGIVYTLTKAHARSVAAFLRAHGIEAEHYTGGGAPSGAEEQRKQELEQRLIANEVKAVVATPALGMGFDKPDLAFVVHFEMPQSLIHYYQQVGRAGRAVDDALGILLYGDGDRRITDYFIAQAFPPVAVFGQVLAVLDAARPSSLSVTEIGKRAGVGRALTERVLGQLAVELPPPVRRRGQSWSGTGQSFVLDEQRFAELTARRKAEQQRMWDYARGERCLMVFIAEALDDPTASDCGRCSVCVGRELVATSASAAMIDAAANFTEPSAKPKRRRRARRPPTTTTRTKRATRRRGSA